MNKENTKTIKEAIFTILELNYEKHKIEEIEDFEDEEYFDTYEPSNDEVEEYGYTLSEEDKSDMEAVAEYYESIKEAKLSIEDKIHYDIVELIKKIRGPEEEVLKLSDTIFKLNKILDSDEQVKEIIDIEEQMKKIQTKKYISIKEFELIYGKSKTSQQSLRGRLKDPIPYRQTVKNGAITYEVDAVEKWFKNQHK
jgi:hypothetical protein